MSSRGGSTPPPNLVINEDDEDDGFPRTPPILEPETSFCYDSPPLLTPKSDYEELNESKPDVQNPKTFGDCDLIDYSRMDQDYLLLDLLCILCQRVLNDAFAVDCDMQHRFCRNCIIPRWEKHNRKCPRCDASCEGMPTRDGLCNDLVEYLRYDKSKVHYIDTHVDNPSDSDEDYMEMMGCTEEQIEEHNRKRAERKRGLVKKPASEYFPGDRGPKHLVNVIEAREKGLPDPPIPNLDNMWGTKKRKCCIVPMYNNWFPATSVESERKGPLEGMRYKKFACNKEHNWPNPDPPEHAFGVPRDFYTKMRAARKVVKRIEKDPTLTKREKKVAVHHYLTVKAPVKKVLRQFDSSSDDDEPPVRPSTKKFIYPDGYRKPLRAHVKEEVNSDDERESRPSTSTFGDISDRQPKKEEELELPDQKIEQTTPPATPATRRIRKRYNPLWGEPLFLLRDNSKDNQLKENCQLKIYLATQGDTTIAHLQQHILEKLAGTMKIPQDQMKETYCVNFFEVVFEIDGHRVSVIKCDENVTAKLATKKTPTPPTMIQRKRYTKKERMDMYYDRPKPPYIYRKRRPEPYQPPPEPEFKQVIHAPSIKSVPLKSIDAPLPPRMMIPVSSHPSVPPHLVPVSSKFSVMPSHSASMTTFEVGGRRISFPTGNSEPTVREVALRSMGHFKDGNKMIRPHFVTPIVQSGNQPMPQNYEHQPQQQQAPTVFTITGEPMNDKTIQSNLKPVTLPVGESIVIRGMPSSSFSSGQPIIFPRKLIPVTLSANTIIKPMNINLQPMQLKIAESPVKDIYPKNVQPSILPQPLQQNEVSSSTTLASPLTTQHQYQRTTHQQVAPQNNIQEQPSQVEIKKETATAKSTKLPSTDRVFSIKYPHEAIPPYVTLQQLRSKKNLHATDRLTLVYSVSLNRK